MRKLVDYSVITGTLFTIINLLLIKKPFYFERKEESDLFSLISFGIEFQRFDLSYIMKLFFMSLV
jgi:hypothetical protein